MRFVDGIAVDFINTQRQRRGHAVDLIASTGDLRVWLAAHDLLDSRGRITEGDLNAWHGLRAAARTLLTARIDGESPPRAAIDVVNAAASSVPVTTTLRWHQRPIAELQRTGGSPLEQAFAATAADAIEALTGDRGERLARCESPSCSRLLERDHGHQRWCSPGCGDRVRAARYYAKHHAQPRSTSQ
jgi:predicted RNA-binding Zn ribbon-like protein